MTVLAELSNLCAAFLVHTRGEHTELTVRVRVQLIRHFKTCKTDIYLQNKCAHVGLSVHAPVALAAMRLGPRLGLRDGTDDARIVVSCLCWA